MKKSSIGHLLALTIGFTISLLLFRIFYSGSLMYIFFVWNLLLASVPLAINPFLFYTKNKNMQWMLFALWLLFFPNSLYIITDLVHLKARYPVPIWFDTILVFSAAFNGLIIAYASLQQADLFLRSKFSNSITSIIICACLFLSSFGIYLGRFLRWNSWDILSDPLGLIFQVTDRIFNPLEHPRTWGVTIVFTLFFSIFYFTIKKLPGLIINNK
ncbi:MAG TPA: DUF1361 domain-containing protein [Chitinophagaceae bacterium]|nr:DUF1361 domain-containing protein [Chitinophagaceae bacterium]